MSQRLRRTLTVTFLLAAIMISAYISTRSTDITGSVSKADVYRYSDAAQVKPSKSEIELLLSALGEPINVSDLGLLHTKLVSLGQVGSSNTLIGDYVQTISDLSGNLSQIQAQLNETRLSLDSGNKRQASLLVGTLEQRKLQSEQLLRSSTSLLARISQQYQINTTDQVRNLNMLNQLYDKYSVQIDQFAAQLRPQVSIIPTVLSLNSSGLHAFVGQSIEVSGFLKTQNGTSLENRTIIISWNSAHNLAKTSLSGIFYANVSFYAGSPPGLTTIVAGYAPSGQDELLYSGSTAQVQVEVFYEPTKIDLVINPIRVKPLDVVDIWGNLSSTQDHRPLGNRTVIFQLDSAILGNTTTSNLGDFSSYIRIPKTARNGTHTIQALFNATNDIFAPSNASYPLFVETFQTQTQLMIDRSTILSGMKATIYVTVGYTNVTSSPISSPSGNVTIYVDNVPFANGTLDSQGSFISSIPIPLGASYGSHSILVQYIPDEPWIQNSQALVMLFVVSTPIVALSASTITVIAVFGTYVVRRRRREAALRLENTAIEPTLKGPPQLPAEFSRSSLIATLQEQTDDASKVKTAYSLVQMMISSKLGIQSRTSETPSEYLLRINEAAPSLKKTVRALVDLFELAEYSPYPIGNEQSREANHRVLELREKLESVKTAEVEKR